MAPARILRIYLDDEPRARAEAGKFNIMNKIRAAFENRGFRVEFTRNSEAERARSATRRGYALFHMDHPFHARALTLRRAYFYPFWRIEASARRWEWEIARAHFDPEAIDARAAAGFAGYWRGQLLPGIGLDSPRDGSVYVPLQGVLLERRSFQTQSPLDMLRTVLTFDPGRQVVAALHPKETYLPEELAALKKLVDAEPRLRLSSEPMERLLSRCDYVVTQNSSVALMGYFLHKPAVLFAQVDFHHIAANVGAIGAQAAIEQAPEMTPEFDRYLHWFLKETAINGGSDEVEDQIIAAVRRHGWQV